MSIGADECAVAGEVTSLSLSSHFLKISHAMRPFRLESCFEGVAVGRCRAQTVARPPAADSNPDQVSRVVPRANHAELPAGFWQRRQHNLSPLLRRDLIRFVNQNKNVWCWLVKVFPENAASAGARGSIFRKCNSIKAFGVAGFASPFLHVFRNALRVFLRFLVIESQQAFCRQQHRRVCRRALVRIGKFVFSHGFLRYGNCMLACHLHFATFSSPQSSIAS